MVKIITPSLGGRLDYNDAYQPTPAPGTIFHADDSHHYILARASAAVAANTQVILTEPAFTVAPARAIGPVRALLCLPVTSHGSGAGPLLAANADQTEQ